MKKIRQLTDSEKNAIAIFAGRIGVTPELVAKMIAVETAFTMSPVIHNPLPNQSARGIFQFIDSTAYGLGFRDSLDLVTQNPTIESQLDVAYRMFKPYLPFKNEYEFTMANFIPTHRKDSPLKRLDSIKKSYADANPHLTYLGDYYKTISAIKLPFSFSPRGASNSGKTFLPVIALTAGLLYFFFGMMPHGCRIVHDETTIMMKADKNAHVFELDTVTRHLPY